MSYRSNKVKAWRKRTKQNLIDALGGSCLRCNYSTTIKCLDFHHVFSKDKEKGIARMLSNPTKIEVICAEVSKCVVLCCRCHGEFHAGIYLQDFSINLKSYEDLLLACRPKAFQISIENECKVCGNRISITQKTCSRACAAKIRYSTEWDSIDLIYEIEVKKRTKVSIAEQLGVSDAAVNKRYKKLCKEKLV